MPSVTGPGVNIWNVASYFNFMLPAGNLFNTASLDKSVKYRLVVWLG